MTRILPAAAGIALIASGLAADGAAGAARASRSGSAASLPEFGLLTGVAATSARNAWAVGSTGAGTPLILRWNGATWKPQPSPASDGGYKLQSVAAASATDAWAVGYTTTRAQVQRTLILHWNGVAWKPVPSPTGARGGSLGGVVAVSARNAWAVGQISYSAPLILHWGGGSWKRAPVPEPRTGQLHRGSGRDIGQERLGGRQHRRHQGLDLALERRHVDDRHSSVATCHRLTPISTQLLRPWAS